MFNVHTRSIFQCDAHNGGVAVLFQYPNCILPNDKIRLFGSLRADVASLLPPTTLHYITEHRVVKGKYSLHFDCELFSEKYVEYCFVYVNQAITGAVTDVRMDCVPTYPISGWYSGLFFFILYCIVKIFVKLRFFCVCDVAVDGGANTVFETFFAKFDRVRWVEVVVCGGVPCHSICLNRNYKSC